MRSKLKTGLLAVALVGLLAPATACDDYIYGFDSFVLGIDVYPIRFVGYCGDCYDDDDDFFDDLEDFWDDFEDDWDDLFDD